VERRVGGDALIDVLQVVVGVVLPLGPTGDHGHGTIRQLIMHSPTESTVAVRGSAVKV